MKQLTATRTTRLLSYAALATMWFISGAAPDFAGAIQDKPADKVVRLVIDYNDGVEKHFTRLAWKDGMTVLDAMNDAAKLSRGIKFEHSGSGETAFLKQIDDTKNEGGGAGKRNWVYRVNDELADRSFGVYQLQPSDKVTWRFGKYPPE